MKWRERNTFQKVTMIVVWIMIIVTVGGIALQIVPGLIQQFSGK